MSKKMLSVPWALSRALPTKAWFEQGTVMAWPPSLGVAASSVEKFQPPSLEYSGCAGLFSECVTLADATTSKLFDFAALRFRAGLDT
jgi:hypothetical protein